MKIKKKEYKCQVRLNFSWFLLSSCNDGESSQPVSNREREREREKTHKMIMIIYESIFLQNKIF